MYEGAIYAASTASTTSGSGRRGTGSGASGARRVRLVRLVRPRRAAPAFGFSLRGGREHAAGFFVTKVELNSEAHRQGLKMGDQVISVNGYRVEDAVHSELTHYIANQTRLKVKVRNVGMIPVKEKGHEPLTWKFVSDNASMTSEATTTSSSPTLCHESERLKDIHLSILVPPKAKLGCGICKGPEWKPGIFVQFVKDHGIAREAGLRAGDQILSCNGIDFANVQFNEAISTMKQFARLELRVRPGAGVELVSPESSGYNSSASSAAGGDHSPHAPDKRLSIVTEETTDFKDRLILNRLKRRTWDSIDFDWRGAGLTHSFDAPSDIEPDYDSPSIPNNPHTYENKNSHLRKKEFVSNPSNKTIINLTENGATIQCSYNDHRAVNKTVSDTTQNRRNGEMDKKTIVVEVHHNKTSKVSAISNTCAATVVSRDRCSETTSMSSDTTLSSAIADEIMRRKLKKTTDQSAPPPPAASKKNGLLKPPDCEKQRQHDALMDEFKKVHRKMFSSLELEQQAAASKLNERHDGVDRQQTLALRKSAPAAAAGYSNGDVKKTSAPAAAWTPAEKPPPPPPMPIEENGDDTPSVLKNGHNKTNEINGINGKAHPILNGNVGTNGALKRTPTPDYESSNIESLTAKLKLKTHPEETCEVDSIESYKMRNPSSPQPKPPSTYFRRSPNGTATMKKTGRPVSITIGEYPSRTMRKEPSKLDFLNGESKVNGEMDKDQVPIAGRLQSELAMTLSRSNLRKKTELLANKLDSNGKIPAADITSSDESEPAQDKNFQKRYGNNILPTPPQISIPKVPVVKTNSHFVSQHIAMLAGKVASEYKQDEKSETPVNKLQENRKTISFDQVMMATGDQ